MQQTAVVFAVHNDALPESMTHDNERIFDTLVNVDLLLRGLVLMRVRFHLNGLNI
jgi:hypothetical protein